MLADAPKLIKKKKTKEKLTSDEELANFFGAKIE
nr:MAG TPA: hypothetical protein [Caudoviricetes sp.]